MDCRNTRTLAKVTKAFEHGIILDNLQCVNILANILKSCPTSKKARRKADIVFRMRQRVKSISEMRK